MITILLLFISFSAYAVMWTLQFHYTSSVFRRLNHYYWNPGQSWVRKWKYFHDNSIPLRDKNGDKIEWFWGSSTIFVWLTDAFHLFQSIFLNTLFLAFAFIAEGKELYGYTLHWWSAYFGIRLIYAVVFELGFGVVIDKEIRYGKRFRIKNREYC